MMRTDERGRGGVGGEGGGGGGESLECGAKQVKDAQTLFVNGRGEDAVLCPADAAVKHSAPLGPPCRRSLLDDDPRQTTDGQAGR